MFLPTDKGAKSLNLHPDRPLHYKGHLQYNKYVGIILDNMFIEYNTSPHHLSLLNIYLRRI